MMNRDLRHESNDTDGGGAAEAARAMPPPVDGSSITSVALCPRIAVAVHPAARPDTHLPIATQAVIGGRDPHLGSPARRHGTGLLRAADRAVVADEGRSGAVRDTALLAGARLVGCRGAEGCRCKGTGQKPAERRDRDPGQWRSAVEHDCSINFSSQRAIFGSTSSVAGGHCATRRPACRVIHETGKSLVPRLTAF